MRRAAGTILSFVAAGIFVVRLKWPFLPVYNLRHNV